MQVLKEEVKSAILQAALDEFRKKGFKGSSMREIAENAGIAVGNLYRYFKDKEDLFYAVVGPAFHKMIALVRETKGSRMTNAGAQGTFIEYIADLFINIYEENKIEVSILLNGSQGTKFEKAKEDVVLMIEERIVRNMLKKEGSDKPMIEDDFLIHIIAVNFVDGFAGILTRYQNDFERIRKVIIQYIQFYFKSIDKRF